MVLEAGTGVRDGRESLMAPRKVAACGTLSGYRRHLRQNETPCQGCADARLAYMRAWRERNPGYEQQWREAHREERKELAREWRASNPGHPAAYRLFHAHGLTPEALAKMRLAQDGRCYLCREPLDDNDAAIDHDHRCCPPRWSCALCQRGIACQRCNRLIGIVKDDAALLRRIADGLEVAAAAAGERIAAADARLPFPEADAS